MLGRCRGPQCVLAAALSVATPAALRHSFAPAMAIQSSLPPVPPAPQPLTALTPMPVAALFVAPFTAASPLLVAAG